MKNKYINDFLIKLKECKLEKKDNVYDYSMFKKCYYTFILVFNYLVALPIIFTIKKVSDKVFAVPDNAATAVAYFLTILLALLGIYIAAIIICMFSRLANYFLKIFD